MSIRGTEPMVSKMVVILQLHLPVRPARSCSSTFASQTVTVAAAPVMDPASTRFATTFGFSTIQGFNVSLNASASAPEPGTTPPRNSIPATPSLRVFLDPELAKNRHRPPEGAPVVTEVGSVGWKGLLEMSRNSGASGIVGVLRSVGVLQFPRACALQFPHA